ncbi:MAG TPA: PDZ domain-containing protein, partial [Vicinamibacterales bacterium]|nr:PDZ domain-containing protein [Vicinamibacterales bacterium]
LRHKKGVVVAAASAGVPFSQQGRLQAGDVIYSINGKPVDNLADLNAAMAAFKQGAPAVVQLERAGVLMFVSFRIEK